VGTARRTSRRLIDVTRPHPSVGLTTGDVLMGMHTVRGIADSINDLAYGLVGSLVYTILFRRFAFTRRRRAKPDKRRPNSVARDTSHGVATK
jgi:hypothetical protein